MALKINIDLSALQKQIYPTHMHTHVIHELHSLGNTYLVNFAEFWVDLEAEDGEELDREQLPKPHD